MICQVPNICAAYEAPLWILICDGRVSHYIHVIALPLIID